MNIDISTQTETVIFNFRRVFLTFLNSPTEVNQEKLSKAGAHLAKIAFERIKQSFEPHGLAAEVNLLTKEALKNIKISKQKMQRIHSFIQEQEPESPLYAAFHILKEHLVTEEQDKVFASIYAIELDGYRLRNIDPEASAACLALSAKLLEQSQHIDTRTTKG